MPGRTVPALALQAAGYRSAYHGEKSYNGVAILAKNELREVRTSLCDEVVDPQARVIAATVASCAYSQFTRLMDKPLAHAYEYKLQWYRRLRHCLAKEKSPDLVVCGDFNVARRTSMFTMPTFGTGPSWLRTANARLFVICAASACTTRFESITRKENFSAGGIIKCAPSKKIVACA